MYNDYLQNMIQSNYNSITILCSILSPFALIMLLLKKCLNFKILNPRIIEIYHCSIIVSVISIIYFISNIILTPISYFSILLSILTKKYKNQLNQNIDLYASKTIVIKHFIQFLVLGIPFLLYRLIKYDYRYFLKTCFTEVSPIKQQFVMSFSDFYQFKRYILKYHKIMKTIPVNQFKYDKQNPANRNIQLLVDRLSIKGIIYLDHIYHLLKQVKMQKTQIRSDKIDYFDIMQYNINQNC